MVPALEVREGDRAMSRETKKLVDALNDIVRFEDQDPDEQFYPSRCSDDEHHWHENADAEGDTCNCGAWYRFADRIIRTPLTS